MSDQKRLSFDDVSAGHLEKYLRHAIEIILRRQERSKYTHDRKGRELPKIMIGPTDPKILKAGKDKAITQIFESKEEMSPEFRKKLDEQTKKKHERLKKKYEERIVFLQSEIANLEEQIASVIDELTAYANGSHPHIAHHESKKDLEDEVAALEHKLQHYEQKSEKYHELGERLSSAKNRLNALDV